MKRVVMGTRPDGLSDVLYENDLDFGAEQETLQQIRDLWVNTQTPAPVASTVDPIIGRVMHHEPPEGGALFRVITVPPGSRVQWPSPEKMVELHKAIHSVHVPTVEYLKAAKHVTMHRTNTLNYFVLTAGELWALSEDKDVRLLPGDCLVQLGCIHGWDNRSDKPAVMACVLVSAKPPF